LLVTIPAIAARTLFDFEQPALASLIFGIGIVGAAFLLAWAAEAAQTMISAGLAIAAVALLTILPEYAVDMTFAWKAGADPGLEAYLQGGPEPTAFALPAANLTGANRLLSGLGWPVVILLYWLRSRRPVQLTPAVTPEIVVLGLAALYSVWMFWRSEIALHDAAVLFILFVIYLWLVSRTGENEQEELLGPPAEIVKLRSGLRKAVIGGLFVFAGIVVVACAEPFADGLVHTGDKFGIDEFILVQWIAPLASEAPEMLVAIIFTLRGKPVFGMAALISAAVNQWSLLVASLPVVFSLSAGHALALPLDDRQQAEVFLTMAQIVFAVILIAKLRIGWMGASALLILFVLNLFLNTTRDRYLMGVAFLVLTALTLIIDREHLRALRDRVAGFAEMVRERAGIAGPEK
jgi:cation:H+ antiporter